jgi:hypothetical protein
MTVLTSAASASAVELYNNGPTTDEYTSWFINQNQQIADTFTVTQDSSVDVVNFTGWTNSGAVITSLDWSIQSEPGRTVRVLIRSFTRLAVLNSLEKAGRRPEGGGACRRLEQT